jgi:hypothetical protein
MKWRATIAGWIAFVGAAPPGLAVQEAEQLTMGFYLPGIREANQADVRISLQLWADEVGRKYDIQARALTYDDMSALRQAVDRRSVNLVIAPGMELAEAFAPEELAEGFAGTHLGTEEGVAIVVAATAGLRRFTDLRGKRVARLSNDRLAEVFLEIQCRRQFGQACRDALQLVEEKRDIQAIHKVFFGQADAALVSISTLHAAGELNPQVRARLQTMLDWKTRSPSLGLMTRHASPAFRERIQRSALEAAKTVRGRQILEIFKTDIMETASANDLQPYWRLHHQYRELLDAKPTRKK